MSVDPQQRQQSCLEFIADLNGRSAAKRLVPMTTTAHPANKVSIKWSSEERRAKVRYPSKQEGRCAPALSGKGHHWIAHIHDVSASGVSLLLNRRFEPRTLLVLELQHADDSVPRTLLIQVRNVRRQPRRKWLLGCRFVRGLDEDILKQLV